MASKDLIPFKEGHLITKEELFERWQYATKQEVIASIWTGKLIPWVIYKGPINGIVWCRYVQFADVEYLDHNCDTNAVLEKCTHFTLENVKKCEEENPDYIGEVTPEMLGLEDVDCLDDRVKKYGLQLEEYHPSLFIARTRVLISRLEKKLKKYEKLEKAEIPWLCRFVIDRIVEGKTKNEIAAELYSLGEKTEYRGITRPIIGALLHPEGDIADFGQYADKLYKAKKTDTTHKKQKTTPKG